MIIEWHDSLYTNDLLKITWLSAEASIESWMSNCDNVIIEYVCLITCEIYGIWFNQWDDISSIKLLRYVCVWYPYRMRWLNYMIGNLAYMHHLVWWADTLEGILKYGRYLSSCGWLRYIWNKFSNNYEVPHALSNITRMHCMNVALDCIRRWRWIIIW